MKEEIAIIAKPKSAKTIAEERLDTGVISVSAKIDPMVQEAMQNGVVDINRLREIQAKNKSLKQIERKFEEKKL